LGEANIRLQKLEEEFFKTKLPETLIKKKSEILLPSLKRKWEGITQNGNPPKRALPKN